MKRIDRQTIQRILDAADIVDVVSDYVTLKKRGANYTGLCPFHNERTPSFSVSRSKGICKCFSCGKGGSPVNFLMEIEQVSYYEALRLLAKKYGIEIQEREMTDAERQAESERESMLAVNEFAMKHFAHNLVDTDAGRNIGLAYFRERGINEQMIERFHLGYSLDDNDDLLRAATKAGYSEKYLLATGLCSKNDHGRIYDRFRGRVIYPVFTLSGKVVAFGGRTLRTDKSMAKYVNSPESVIYSKRAELYGLYQAKQAINKKDRCILVEGYMDVISMHQSGIENVVASSGTSLTERQVNLIHRFTENVTVIYDSDPAGIKASLRGIDMFLAEGLSVKVVSLPDGDDPDSYAQNHSASEVEEYLETHATDFIRFKTSILLQGVENDPIARSRVITDIVRSISVIPSEIQRTIYIQECSRMLDIDEAVLSAQTVKFIAENAKKRREERQRQTGIEQLESDPETAIETVVPPVKQPRVETAPAMSVHLRRYEEQVLKYVLKYGMMVIGEAVDENERHYPLTLLEFIESELAREDVTFTNPDLADTFAAARSLFDNSWPDDFQEFQVAGKEAMAARRSEGQRKIAETAGDMAEIERLERQLEQQLAEEAKAAEDDFVNSYIARHIINDPDDAVRRIATELISEKYILSKIHTKYAHVESEAERLNELVPRAIFELKDAILEWELRNVRARLRALKGQSVSETEVEQLMEQLIDLTQRKSEFAKYLGVRIIAPR